MRTVRRSPSFAIPVLSLALASCGADYRLTITVENGQGKVVQAQVCPLPTGDCADAKPIEHARAFVSHIPTNAAALLLEISQDAPAACLPVEVKLDGDRQVAVKVHAGDAFSISCDPVEACTVSAECTRI